MRHRVRNRKLGCRTSHRKAMMRNMVTSLMEHGRIVTTVTRAKELRRLADKMVTLGKRGDLHARRQALSVIRSKAVVARLFDEWAPKFQDRNGGYTRIVRIGPRRGDASMMAVIELAVESLNTGKKKKPSAAKAETTAAPASVIPEAPDVAEVATAEVANEEQEASAVQTESEGAATEETAETASVTAEATTAEETEETADEAVEASAEDTSETESKEVEQTSDDAEAEAETEEKKQ